MRRVSFTVFDYDSEDFRYFADRMLKPALESVGVHLSILDRQICSKHSFGATCVGDVLATDLFVTITVDPETGEIAA